VRHSRIDVAPLPWAQTYRDFWGTTVTAFEVLDPHRALTVTATSTVSTGPGQDPAVTSGWEDLAEPQLLDDLVEFLSLTDRVRPPADLQGRVDALRRSASSPGALALEICALVHGEVEYEPGSTDVHAEAAAAWEQRSGVCQDIAHLVIGALRSLGIPARYVSGYLLPRLDPVVGEVVHGESHAWVEWWDAGWQSFDPTNALAPGERHIRVATGRDYADVRPLSGIYTGAGTSRMFVDVQLTRLA